jgi:ribosomal protein S12 methylthiotransferase accessory factor
MSETTLTQPDPAAEPSTRPPAWPVASGLAGLVTEQDQAKVAMPGTDRAWPAELSLDRARRAAAAVGVTRLADVTRLDRIGIHTWQAIRPTSKTLTVSQGKGMSDTLAQVSALMESIELWHAENPVLDSFTATIGELRPRLTYDPYALPLVEGSLLHDALPVRWTMARRLHDGLPVPVPYRMVHLELTEPAGWRPGTFQETSNGLASGNTVVEATLHALYEVIERDAVCRSHRLGVAGTRFDPRALESGPVSELLGAFEAAGVTVDVRVLPSQAGLPVACARIVSEDYPVVAGGYGCHLRAEIATTRALTEAAQSRLTGISGARDDLARNVYRPVHQMLPPPPDGGATRALPPQVRSATSHETLLDDLAEVSQRCVGAFSAPLLVDLSRPEIGIPVVRVIVPGCELNEAMR